MSGLSLLQSLHENLSSRAQVKSVFGEPITAGDKTIIPVARIAYAFGGGTGSGGLEIKTARGEGGGGGGGVGALPVGVFEVAPDGTRCVAVGDKKKLLGALVLGSGFCSADGAALTADLHQHAGYVVVLGSRAHEGIHVAEHAAQQLVWT